MMDAQQQRSPAWSRLRRADRADRFAPAGTLIALLLTLLLGCHDPSRDGEPGASAPAPTTNATTASSTATATASVAATADGGAADAKQWSDDWPPEEPFRSAKTFDAVIRGADVIDGTGRPRVRADVLIDDERIAHIGSIDGSVKVRKEIDATGMVVTPGFIDAHSHGDPLGRNDSFTAQGVTTICVGQDGRSASDDRVKYWAGRVRKKRLRLNVVPFVGHGTIRSLAGVGVKKDPSDKQLAKMARLVEKEMKAGAWGLSTGLEYSPGRFAPQAELVAIAKPVAQYDGVVMSHLRSEDDDQIDAALDELIAQGKGSGARVHVAHIKVVYGRGTKRADQLLARMQKARDDGVMLTADIYPYNASYTNISIVFPDFAKPPNKYPQVKRTRRDELADYLRKRIARRGGPEATLFGSDPYRGKTLAEVAKDKGKPFEDVLIDDIGPGGMSAAYFVMDDELQARLLVDGHVMIGTDGGTHSRHPRGSGSFAKVLSEFVGKRKLLSLEEAIRKMTDLTARTVGLDRLQRGRLRAGFFADLLVFDPAQVHDRADYEHPSRQAEGMAWVFINGSSVRARGKGTSKRPGKVLLRAE